MTKRISLSFALKQSDYEDFKLKAEDLIKTNMFRSQIEIMECFIQFLMNATGEELIKLKLAPTNKKGDIHDKNKP